MEVRSRSGRNLRVVRLPDDLVAEILARVPYRSLCRFKRVSRSWRALCSDPAVRRRCPQTLAGFFFSTTPLAGPSQHVRHFVNASRRGGAPSMVDPSFSFLPAGHRDAWVVDSCNGLLLCTCEDMRSDAGSCHFVCNPATEKWIDLPDTEVTTKSCSCPTMLLGFDPAVSSHYFREFVLVTAQETFELRNQVIGVEIYSSETGSWTTRQSGWDAGALSQMGIILSSSTEFCI